MILVFLLVEMCLLQNCEVTPLNYWKMRNKDLIFSNNKNIT